MATWHMSLHHTTVSNATLLSNLAPIFIALWIWWAHRVRFSGIFVIGMLIALCGAVLLAAPNAGVAHAMRLGSHPLLGDALGVCSGVFYAAYQLSIKDTHKTKTTTQQKTKNTSVTALALLPFALLADAPFWPLHA